ncbi:MAG TPA: hypothetical protein GX015_05245 [Corynebacterium sp.]|uniref:hypothetical protein n=1 Tax=Corynebacterium sp. TaxID=1720 RepID=UPI0017BB67C6|nr:hypothetical protein [Corynebacterium sp.]HHT31937.1 hypothetical protein [Corynebacterium sp.]
MSAADFPTIFLFIVAGVLVGGAWSAYQAGSRFGTIVLGLLAVLATAGAVLWLMGEMN